MANKRIVDLPAINPAGVIDPNNVLFGADNLETTRSEKVSIADMQQLGALGPTGPTGPAGPVGPTGPTGPIGPTGPQKDWIREQFTLSAGHTAPLTLAVTPTDEQSLLVFQQGLNIYLESPSGYTYSAGAITLDPSISAVTNAGDVLIVRYV